MGRGRQSIPAKVAEAKPVVPIQTINPEGHTGNKWVPRGSAQLSGPITAATPEAQPTQAEEQATQALPPGQQPGGLQRRTMPGRMGSDLYKQRMKLRQGMPQRQGLLNQSLTRGKSAWGRIAAPGQPMGSPVTPGVTKLPPPTTY